MSQIETAGKRSRGRPVSRTDEETRRLIAEAARDAFMARGYAGTGMDEVAKGAGVSKKTLYRLIPAKADLFTTSVTERIARFLSSVDEDAIGSLGLDAALERLMTELGNLTLSASTIALQKLVFAESDRFPELATTFQAEAIAPARAVLAAFLRKQCEKGLIALDDPELATGMLRGMMIMEPQRAVMMGQGALPSEREIAERAKACVKVFLKGCLTERGAEALAPAG